MRHKKNQYKYGERFWAEILGRWQPFWKRSPKTTRTGDRSQSKQNTLSDDEEATPQRYQQPVMTMDHTMQTVCNTSAAEPLSTLEEEVALNTDVLMHSVVHREDEYTCPPDYTSAPERANSGRHDGLRRHLGQPTRTVPWQPSITP